MIDLLARHTFLALALFGLIGCGGGDPTGNGGNGGGSTTVTPVTNEISAAEGGTVADTGKTVQLTIPPGSLAADTAITLTVSDKTADTIAPIYAFGPAGTAFETPATIAIIIDSAGVPQGKKAALAVKEGTGFSAVQGSVALMGAVQAQVSTLATYSAIVVDEGPCDGTCMAQAGAVCCTMCGCQGAVTCMPVCTSPAKWDCEVGCCFDYDKLMCAD